MKNLFLLCLSLLSPAFFGVAAVAAATNASPAQADSQAAAEKKLCGENLLKIFAAIQQYEKDKKDIPNWLSDLVPKYLKDPNLLVCPTARRTGRTEPPPLADPNLPSSYLFEFCPLPLGKVLLPAAPERTRREWKRRQMGLLGSAVPIVRCRNHDPALNLSFDGRLFDSPAGWQYAFTNRVSMDQLNPPSLFADVTNPNLGSTGGSEPKILPRDKKAGRTLLDLTGFFNLGLNSPLPGVSTVSLKSLGNGIQVVGDTRFDIRGVVQLDGKDLRNPGFPAQLKGVPVGQKCKRLRFLHATTAAEAAEQGAQVLSYVIRFSGNQARVEIPVFLGRDIANVKAIAGEDNQALKPAWGGTDPASARIYLFTWENIAPEAEIESIDLLSAGTKAAPMVLAITAE